MAIEFSRAAESDLLEIFLYGIEEHGLAQAERYKGQLDNNFQTLSENPKIARLRQEITPPVRVYPAQKHMIVYTIMEDGQRCYHKMWPFLTHFVRTGPSSGGYWASLMYKAPPGNCDARSTVVI